MRSRAQSAPARPAEEQRSRPDGRCRCARRGASSQAATEEAAEGRTGPAGRRGAVWIVVMGLLLAGIVALNVTVLRSTCATTTWPRSGRSWGRERGPRSKLASRSSSPRTAALPRSGRRESADHATTTYLRLAEVSARLPNRRIRLLLVFFVLAPPPGDFSAAPFGCRPCRHSRSTALRGASTTRRSSSGHAESLLDRNGASNWRSA